MKNKIEKVLFQDYQTKKKSITITFLTITFILTCVSVIANIVLLCLSKQPYPSVVWASLGLCGPFIALYWNKRVRISASNIELMGNDK